MTRGNNKMTIFRDAADYAYYLSLLAKYKANHPFNLYHYCLMPNHVHLLVQTKKATLFAIFMKRLNLAYFHHYRQRYGWVGHFWQDRYKSQPVGKDGYFIQCGKYIELNPVRKTMVLSPEEYRYSSYRHYVLGERNSLITEDMFYLPMGGTPRERQRQYHSLVISDLVMGSYHRRAWGSHPQRYNEHKKIHYHIQ